MTRRYSAWFPKGVQPVRVGIYQTKWKIDKTWIDTWAHWDGVHWGFDSSYIEHVKPFNKDSLLFPEQYKVWRGLSREAKAGEFCG